MEIQHSRSINIGESSQQSMNVIFNKNERIISGKAAVKGIVGGISGQSRNVNRGS